MLIKSKSVLVLLAIALVAFIVPVWMFAQTQLLDQTSLTTMSLSDSESSQQRLVNSITSMASSSMQQTIPTGIEIPTPLISTEAPTGFTATSAITTGSTIIVSSNAAPAISQATLQATANTTSSTTTKATTKVTTKVTTNATSTVATTKSTTAVTTAATTYPTNADSWRSELFRLTNLERTKKGLPALQAATPALAKAAGIRAAEIVTKFAHTRLDGTDWHTVLHECGVTFNRAGENLAMCSAGSQTQTGIIGLWMNSPGHRDNIMHPTYTMLAIGYIRANGKDFFVQLFIS